ncbi:MAG: hypothetical protein H0W28_08340 [Pyrinomonadaceae bacterium]|jgi:hypothetical protein|nr:hypothetical protein [Pyrinomonadaceae bacterium]
MKDDPRQLNDRAEAMMGEEKWAEAIKLLESRPRMLERDAGLSWNLGWAYFKLGDWKVAQRHF